MKLILLSIMGISAGLLVAGAACALLTSIGVITRIVHKTKTQSHLHLYEFSIFAGITLSNFLYIYNFRVDTIPVVNYLLLIITGLFMGIFVGCLAMSLAEVLDVSTIFFRRLNMKKSYGIIIICIAFGKLFGSLFSLK